MSKKLFFIRVIKKITLKFAKGNILLQHRSVKSKESGDDSSVNRFTSLRFRLTSTKGCKNIFHKYQQSTLQTSHMAMLDSQKYPFSISITFLIAFQSLVFYKRSGIGSNPCCGQLQQLPIIWKILTSPWLSAKQPRVRQNNQKDNNNKR